MAWITPITDRKSIDVENLKNLANAILSVGWDNATTEQQTAWLFGQSKGALNYWDINRIQDNILFLRDWLASEFLIFIEIDESNPSTWDISLTPLLSNINIIRDNVNKLVNESYKYSWNPIIDYNNNPDYDDINAIEINLAYLYEILTKIPLSWHNCGTFNCGQNDII